MLHLVTFGGLALESVNEAVAPRLSAQRLAVLAVLAAEGDRRVSRERLTGLFWPDADEERARHSLRQALYTLRQEVGREVVRSDFVLSLDASAITSDVAAFRAALARGDRPAAGKLVRGPFLQGFYVPSAAPFQRWAEEERARLHTLATGAIAALATEASSGNDLDGAIGWWRQLTELDPLSGRFALGYLQALAARGDRAEALAFARSHTALVRRELETEADPEFGRLAASLRSSSGGGTTAAPPGPAEPTPEVAAPETAPPPPPANLTTTDRRTGLVRRAALFAGAAIAAIALLRPAAGKPPGSADRSATPPTLAVGVIREDGPDSARVGPLIADMLSANLSRMPGLQVVASARIEQLMQDDGDTSAVAYWEAARRAGATELLEGRLLDRSRDGYTIEVRRIDLRTGLLKGAYRSSAPTQFRLVDSVTAMIARNLRLTEPQPPAADVTTSSATAYRLYEEGIRAYHRLDFGAAAQMMRAALEDDSTFAMAAYYDALLTDSPMSQAPTERAIRLAARASERERLLISTALMSRVLGAPAAIQMAETLATRYPNDARALEMVARARQLAGDWAGAALAIGRASALDSGTFDRRSPCYLCEDLNLLADVYFWWDSLPAAARTARRYSRLQPDWSRPRELAAWAAAKAGDSAGARQELRQYTALQSSPRSAANEVRIHLWLDSYDDIGRDLRPLLESPRRDDFLESRWWLLIALRNQGRLRDARTLNDTGRLPGFGPPQVSPIAPEAINVGLLALESGDTRTAAAAFMRSWREPLAESLAPGVAARYRAWRGTLVGMAVAATGDTAEVLRLADSVEYWGLRSLYGRDRRAHHYLRGLVHVAAGRDDAAIAELRLATHSPTLGFTRINLELGRALLRRNRAREAAAVVAPALRGEIDAANLYVTRTELHELLARSYDRAGEPDSAAAHYRTVVRSWANADTPFQARRDAARAWLARYEQERSVSKADDR